MTGADQGQRVGRRGALAALAMFGHTRSHFYYPLLIVNLLIHSIQMICTKEKPNKS